MAAGLRAEWVVVNVETPATTQLSDADRDRVIQTLRLAEQLGAETATLSGHDVAAEVLTYARRRNVTRIVLGKPAWPRWRELLFGSVVNELVRRSGDIDVYVITGEREGPQPAAAERRAPQPVDWGELREGCGGRGALDRGGVDHVPLLRACQPHHGVPARHRRGGDAPRSGAGHPRVCPQRGGVRLLLRAAIPVHRGLRYRVRGDLRGHAGGGRPDQHAHRANPRTGGGLAPARAPDRGPLRNDTGPGQPAGAGRAAPGRGAPRRGGLREPHRRVPSRPGWTAHPPGGRAGHGNQRDE